MELLSAECRVPRYSLNANREVVKVIKIYISSVSIHQERSCRRMKSAWRESR